MTYTINTNTEFNSLEIFFDGKPNEAIRSALKDLKFRWHSVKKCWYVYSEESKVRAAISGDATTAAQAPAKAKKATVTPSHSVKVGDLFYTSWGYEQTNVNFFQVVELVGSSSVRVREVFPELIEEEAVCGMAANRRYKLPDDGEMLPANPRASFIEDNERGDLRRVKTGGYYGDCLKVGKPNCYQEIARRYDGGTVYVSWYY